MLKISSLISTVLGVGYAPFAPGTVGSLVGLLLGHWMRCRPWWMGGFVLCVLLVAGTWAIGNYVRSTGKQDPKEVVVDEFVGMWITLGFIPCNSWGWSLAAFGMFRVFDIAKPGPVGWIDRSLHNEYGVMGDDVVAGFLAGVTLWVAQMLLNAATG